MNHVSLLGDLVYSYDGSDAASPFDRQLYAWMTRPQGGDVYPFRIFCRHGHYKKLEGTMAVSNGAGAKDVSLWFECRNILSLLENHHP